MVRIVLCLLLMITSVPAFAGSFEDALRQSDYVMLYMTSPSCSYCKKFDPIFQKLAGNYSKKCKFVKVDSTTPYGRKLSAQVGAAFVPYVLLFQTKQQMMMQVMPECLLDYACINKEINSFIK